MRFQGEIKKQVFSFRYTKQTSKNVADTTSKAYVCYFFKF